MGDLGLLCIYATKQSEVLRNEQRSCNFSNPIRYNGLAMLTL